MAFHKDTYLGKDGLVKITTPPCIVCGKESEMKVPANVLQNAGSTPIQKLWPEADAATRELFRTGIHDECWKSMA